MYQVEISFSKEPTLENSRSLKNLQELIDAEALLKSAIQSTSLPNSKGDINTALTIVATALSSITTIISILTYWSSKHTKYTYKVQVGEKEFIAENLEEADFKLELEMALKQEEKAQLVINNEKHD